MRADEVIARIEAEGSWVDWCHTRDIVLAGDPGREVARIGVAWMATMAAVREAGRRHVDLFITHENPFYAPTTQPFRIVERLREEKRSLINRTGMVVYRCHDLWDKIPSVGVADQWARALGLRCRRDFSSYNQHATIDETPLGVFAARCADALAPYGEDAVGVFGDLERLVREIGLGTGAATDICEMLKEPCDACIVADDGISNYHDVQIALDAGVSLIVVNHACCEKPGIDSMVFWLRDKFTDSDVVRLDEGYTIHTVRASGAHILV